MLISSNNSSNVITASRFDESEELLMTADGDGRWLMVDDGREGEAKWKCGEGLHDTKYKLSETTSGKGKDGHPDLPQKSSRCFKRDPCCDPPHPKPRFRFEWENYY